MLFLFRRITLQYIPQRPLRTFLTVAGVLIGIALGVGVGLLNESMLASFRDMVHGVSQNSDLTVTLPSRAGMPISILDRIAALPTVRAATPMVRVTGFLTAHPNETVVIVGADALADKGFQVGGSQDDGAVDPLAFLNVPNAMLVSRSLAARHGIRVGDKLSVMAHGDSLEFSVKGIVTERGIGKIYGDVLVVDLYGSEAALGRGGNVDQIDILGKPGVDAELLRRSVSAAVGPGFSVEQPGRNRQAAQMLAGIQKTTAVLGLLALLVGMFLIFNTMSTSVVQRRQEIGTLRALGTSRLQILTLFLGEAFFLGLAGSLLGVLGGFVLAKLMLAQYAKAISNLYFQVHPDTVKLSLPLLLRYTIMGTAASVISAAIPAWRAAAISPLEALGETRLETGRVRGFRLSFILGSMALLGETALLLRPARYAVMDLGVVSVLISFVALALLTPVFITIAGGAMQPFFRRLFGLEARLGGDNLMRSRGRTAVTVAALMVGITLAVSIGGSFISLSQSIDDWITTGITQDIMIRGSINLPGVNAISLPESMNAELKRIPGVADVSAFREAPVSLEGGGIIQVIAQGMDAQMRHDTRRWFEGDPVEGRKKLVGRGFTVISENVSTRYNLHVGDRLVMRTPGGKASVLIAGVQVDYASDLGSAVINREDYKEIFKDEAVDAYNVWLSPGTDSGAARERIRDAFTDRRLFIQTNTEFRAEIHEAVSQLFALSDVVQLLVIIIAVIGIVNTLLVSILDRTRELGVMRAIGFTREQLARVILWEGAFMGILAGLLGALSGSVFSMTIIHLVNRQLVGWSTAYVFPTSMVWKGFAVAVVSSVAAAWYPARRAARLNVIKAMEYQ